jgi:hypothetical protein
MPIQGDIGEGVRWGDWSTETPFICVDYGSGRTFADDPSYLPVGLELIDIEERVKSSRQFHVVGNVLNNSELPADNIYVKAWIYDSQGRFVGDISDPAPGEVAPGRKGRFNLDQGVNQYSSDNPLAFTNGTYTYELRVSRDSQVRFYAC